MKKHRKRKWITVLKLKLILTRYYQVAETMMNYLKDCESWATLSETKENGEWLAHISFQSPTQDKATREDKIGDGQFYVRENLEKYIAEQARNIEQEQPVVENNHGEDKTQKVIPFLRNMSMEKLILMKSTITIKLFMKMESIRRKKERLRRKKSFLIFELKTVKYAA